MKRIILFLFLTSSALTQVHAQGTGGFFNQQSSKAKLMVKQIVYLEVYLHEIKTGYSNAEKGLNTAHELKNGTYNLHTDYFNSLQQVNPVILNNPRGKAISDLQQQMIRSFSAEIAWQQKEKLFTASEVSYLQNVYDHLLKSSNQDMDELANVLKPGKLQLTDQQRLDRLGRLYDGMKDKNAFAGSFTGKCRKVALSRKHAAQDQSQMKKLYGIQ